MHSKSIKMVFEARINRHKLCTIYAVFDFFVQKLFLTKNYFLIAAINLTTRGPLYTCLVAPENGQNLPFLSLTCIGWDSRFEIFTACIYIIYRLVQGVFMDPCSLVMKLFSPQSVQSLFVFKYLGDCSFWTPGLPEGVSNRLCLSDGPLVHL